MDIGGTLIHISVTRSRFQTCRDTFGESLMTDTTIAGDATASSRQIKALAIATDLMAGGVSAVVKLHRTADALVVCRTDAVEGAKGVETSSTVLTTQFCALIVIALVDILLTVDALVCCFDDG